MNQEKLLKQVIKAIKDNLAEVSDVTLVSDQNSNLFSKFNLYFYEDNKDRKKTYIDLRDETITFRYKNETNIKLNAQLTLAVDINKTYKNMYEKDKEAADNYLKKECEWKCRKLVINNFEIKFQNLKTKIKILNDIKIRDILNNLDTDNMIALLKLEELPIQAPFFIKASFLNEQKRQKVINETERKIFTYFEENIGRRSEEIFYELQSKLGLSFNTIKYLLSKNLREKRLIILKDKYNNYNYGISAYKTEDILDILEERKTFGRLNKKIETNFICPECGSPIVRRIGTDYEDKSYDFYGCSAYPHCEAGYPIMVEGYTWIKIQDIGRIKETVANHKFKSYIIKKKRTYFGNVEFFPYKVKTGEEYLSVRFTPDDETLPVGEAVNPSKKFHGGEFYDKTISSGKVKILVEDDLILDNELKEVSNA